MWYIECPIIGIVGVWKSPYLCTVFLITKIDKNYEGNESNADANANANARKRMSLPDDDGYGDERECIYNNR